MDNTDLQQDELATLKARADLMGVSYHPSIGVEKLREKLRAKLEGTPDPTAEQPPVVDAGAAESERAKRIRLVREANELVRVRITCMNPAKKEWQGEIFTAGNRAVGTIKKYVPFNADEGWHVPRMILQQIQDRQCQVFVTAKDDRGNKVRKGKLIKEFAVEILPPLTKEELAELAARQAATHAIG